MPKNINCMPVRCILEQVFSDDWYNINERLYFVYDYSTTDRIIEALSPVRNNDSKVQKQVDEFEFILESIIKDERSNIMYILIVILTVWNC